MIRHSSEWHLSEITVDELLDRINSNQPPVIFDVRSAKEFNGADGHIPNSMSIPIRKLSSELKDLQSYVYNYKEKEIVTLCPGGGLSLIAVDILVEAGFKNVKSLHGGLDLWRQKGYPTTSTEEMKISRRKMLFKMMRLWLWSIRKRRWYLPEASEITVDELFERLNSNQAPLLIDLRERVEFAGTGQYKYEKYGHIRNANWIPLFQLTSHFEELPQEEEIVTICQGGGMSLVAVDIMVDAGFEDVKSLAGGIKKWHKKGYPLIIESPDEDIKNGSLHDKPTISEKKEPPEKYLGEIHYTVDARGFICPRPILMSKKALITLKTGQVLEILTTDPGSLRDIPSWAHVTGQEFLVSEEYGPKEFRFLVKRMK
jgi:rhodanese-related sulfurtransferase/TusA-related sulfurtransferase